VEFKGGKNSYQMVVRDSDINVFAFEFKWQEKSYSGLETLNAILTLSEYQPQSEAIY